MPWIFLTAVDLRSYKWSPIFNTWWVPSVCGIQWWSYTRPKALNSHTHTHTHTHMTFVSLYPHLPNFVLKMESTASSTFFVIIDTLLIHPIVSPQQPSLWVYQEYISPFPNLILFSTFRDPCDTRPWRREWQPTLVFLPGEAPSTEESGRLQSMGSQRVGHNWTTDIRC